MDYNETLFKLAAQTVSPNANQGVAKLQQSLLNLQNIQSQSLFNEVNVSKKIETDLAALKSQIDQFVATRNQALVQNIQKQASLVESTILLFSPEGIVPNNQLFSKYSLLLNNFMASVR